MDSKKSKEKSILGNGSESKLKKDSSQESLVKDFGVFGKIQKIDVSLQNDDLEYLVYAQFVSQK